MVLSEAGKEVIAMKPMLEEELQPVGPAAKKAEGCEALARLLEEAEQALREEAEQRQPTQRTIPRPTVRPFGYD